MTVDTTLPTTVSSQPGSVEAAVRPLLTDVLGHEPAPDRSLRDCGLDSLAAARLRVELEQRFGVLIPMASLSRCQGVAGLAAMLAEGTAPVQASSQPHPDPQARFEPFGLTAIQQAYLVGKDPDFTGDPIGCHLYREFEVDEADPDRLRAAWQRVVDEQDMLRTVVTEDGRQRVLSEVPDWQLTVNAGGDLLATRERLSHHCYDPGRWPLFDVAVTTRDGGPATVHLSLDALLTDGAGLDYLLESWWRYYREPADRADPATPVGAPELTAGDCLRWLQGPEMAERRRRDLRHWTHRLAGLPPGPAVTTEDPAGSHRRIPLDEELDQDQWAALQRRADDLQVSASTLVLAVFAVTLRRRHRQAAADGGPFSLVLTTNQRSQLPGAVPDVVAPFTSTAVVVVDDDADGELDHVARVLHDRLWEDLDHQSVSAVEALREVREDDAVSLPVVFTSLLEVGRHVPPGSFGDAVTYTLSQTSDVALDCQVAMAGERLRVHWDVAPALAGQGTGELLFAEFINGLVAAGAASATGTTRPLNELQQAYSVARADDPSPWDGCQVYQAIEADELDTQRLAAAWAGMLRDYEPLRSYATADGDIRVLPAWPGLWCLPVVSLDAGTDPEFEARLRTEMVSRAFPLGQWPQFDLRVTRRATGPAVIHLALDLLLLDGRSTHLIARELLSRYANPPEASTAAPPPSPPAHESAATQAAERHWQERVSALPSGPRLQRSGRPDRRRLQAEIDGWPQLRERLELAGVSPDAALTAALNAALAPDFCEPFATTLVRWTGDTEPSRPGEHTRLSWLRGDPGDYFSAARGVQRVIEEDAAADSASGLAQLRRAVLKRRPTAEVRYPVVHTGLLELADHPWPAGTRLREWATCTPDVAMDCIAMDEGDDVLRLFWDVIDDEFAPGQPDEIFQRYVAALQNLTTAPNHAPATGLSAAERDAVLRAWNDTARPYSADGPVHLQFEQRAAEAPDAIAVRWRDGHLTYRELNRWANAIAARLAGVVQAERPVVAISTARGPEMVAAVFGVLKAGGAYLPVEPYLPAERAHGMLTDAGAAALLVSKGDRSWEPQPGLPVVAVDDQAIMSARNQADRNPSPGTDADSLAYIIYTSGSTGRPKGVAVSHRPVHNLLQWAERLFRFTAADVGLCVTSLGFDLSVFDILGLLGFGASIYVADGEEQSDPALLLDVLIEQRITFWNSAPTTLAELAPQFPAPSDRTEALRLVFLSGDWTPLSLPAQLRATFPGMLLVSLGGATEATVWSNYFPVIDVDPDWRSIPYGRPIDNSRYYILDEDLQPCRPGQEGDLFIAGVCLSQGYLNRPELTAERFRTDPFAGLLGGSSGERMYHTGDRAVYTSDGTIVFRGRLDSQVKIRGFRVELGEVEHRLRQHPDVADVIALAREDPDGSKILVAYIRPAGRCAQPAQLRRHAAQSLPAYMVPSHFILVDSFPATANGKLDRDALPDPSAPAPEPPAPEPPAPAPAPEEAATAPAAAVDHQDLIAEIAALFRTHIGTDDLDPAADLWDQGATSFTMVRISTALKKKYRQRIPVATLVEAPTIDGIARAVSAIVTGNPSSPKPPPAPAPPEAAAAPQAPAPEPSVPPEVDLLDDAARLEFHRAQWNRRVADPDAQVVTLPRRDVPSASFDGPAARRDFADQPVPVSDLAALLELLSAEPGERGRYRYPSAGRTYAVQAYLHVRDGGVDGLEAGVYYYRPATHALEQVSDGDGINRKIHFFYNREIYDRSAFELFLVGQTRGIEPLYGEDAQLFLAVEAGYMGQLLMEHQRDLRIGLCPIGTMAMDRVRATLGLDDGHRFLHAFIGGALAERPIESPAVSSPAVSSRAISNPAASSPAEAPAARPADAGVVAVTGIAGRYASCADLEEFWQLLTEGRHALRDWPASRGPAAAAQPPGGYLDTITPADTLRFGISPAEAQALDPQLWLLLDAVWSCIEDAGLRPDTLGGAARVGVFAATMWPDGQLIGADRWRAGEPAQVSGIAADLPNRISHVFGFGGPSVAVNSSCSSSLTALHLARTHLARGECDAAIVAGVNVIAHPYHLALLGGLDLLADRPAGAFSADVAGWMPGEGAGAVLLKPAAAAAADGDPVHALIESSWIGHAGRTHRFGAPSAAALGHCLRDGLRAAELSPDDIDYVECAAAGAAIADAAEIEALTATFASGARPVQVGTVKPNVGHLEAASGLSQLAKVLLQLREGCIAPTLNAAEPNPLVAWDPQTLRLAVEGGPWTPDPGGRPRRALVNALGATGSYAHLVVRAAAEGSPG
jgi:amino acid adenylation domain-containing protein